MVSIFNLFSSMFSKEIFSNVKINDPLNKEIEDLEVVKMQLDEILYNNPADKNKIYETDDYQFVNSNSLKLIYDEINALKINLSVQENELKSLYETLENLNHLYKIYSKSNKICFERDLVLTIVPEIMGSIDDEKSLYNKLQNFVNLYNSKNCSRRDFLSMSNEFREIINSLSNKLKKLFLDINKLNEINQYINIKTKEIEEKLFSKKKYSQIIDENKKLTDFYYNTSFSRNELENDFLLLLIKNPKLIEHRKLNTFIFHEDSVLSIPHINYNDENINIHLIPCEQKSIFEYWLKNHKNVA